MKKNLKKMAVAVLTCSYLLPATGYSTWIIQPSEKYVLTNNNDTVSKPVAYIVGNEKVKFTTIEKALDVAKSGDIVMVIPPKGDNYNSSSNNVVPEKTTYTISRDCVIKEGVTLVIPTDETTSASITDSSTLKTYIDTMSKHDKNRGGNFNKSGKDDSNHYLRTTIQVNDGATITNNGTLVISGFLSGGTSNAGAIGRTSHSYSQILLGKKAKIIQSNSAAETYCFGFIDEVESNNNSEFDVTGGNVYIPFVVYDFRGFYFSVALSGDAMTKYHCSPFNQFGVENISVLIKIGYKATITGIANIYVNYNSALASIDKNLHDEVDLIGNSTSCFIQLTSETYSSVEAKYDKSTSKTNLKIIGGITLNNINLKLDASGYTVNMSTSNSFLPLTYRFDITLEKAANQSGNATFNLSSQRVKMLPGSKLIINSGCTVNSNDFIVYSAFYDGAKGNGKTSRNVYSSVSYPLGYDGAQFVVKSGSNLSSAGSLGGVIYCHDESQITCTTSNCTSYEGWSQITNTKNLTHPWDVDDYLEIKEKKKIVSESFLSKAKIYCGTNLFKKNESFLPKYEIDYGSNQVFSVNGHQDVLFLDAPISFKIGLKNNIYSAYSETATYHMDSTISTTWKNNATRIGIIGSDISISDNNNGVNEFKVQKVTVTCETPLDDGKVPLYVDGIIQLNATIEDSSKAYERTVTWKSSDTSIATVDSTGKVTGKKLGKVTITASCGGIDGTFETEVISSATQINPITTITVTDSNNNSATLNTSEGTSKTFSKFNSNSKYVKENVTFSFALNEGARSAKTEWTLNAQNVGVQYINDKNTKNETVTGDTVTVHFGSGTGASDDVATLILKVTDQKTAEIYTLTLKLTQKADACFGKDTPILLANGAYKNIENLTYGDKILTWNFFTGTFEEQGIAILVDHGEKLYKTIELKFSNGTSITIIGDHGFFDYNLNKFVYLTAENYANYLHHKFVSMDGKNNSTIELIGANISEKRTHAFSLTSCSNYNAIANGLLTCPPPGEFYNWIKMGTKLRYDVGSFMADIKQYGLYDDSVFEPYGISYETFVGFGGAYLKIPVEKEIFSFDYIIHLFNSYKGWI